MHGMFGTDCMYCFFQQESQCFSCKKEVSSPFLYFCYFWTAKGDYLHSFIWVQLFRLLGTYMQHSTETFTHIYHLFICLTWEEALLVCHGCYNTWYGRHQWLSYGLPGICRTVYFERWQGRQQQNALPEVMKIITSLLCPSPRGVHVLGELYEHPLKTKSSFFSDKQAIWYTNHFLFKQVPPMTNNDANDSNNRH